MSGLFARARLAGQDGVRYARSKHTGGIRGAGVIYGSSGYRPIGHSIYCVLQVSRPRRGVGGRARSLRRSAARGRRRRSQIKSASQPAADCRRRRTPSSARRCAQTCWPAPQPPASVACAPEGRRARAKAYDDPCGRASATPSPPRSAPIAALIPCLRDAAMPHASPCRMILRRQPQPCREVTARPERLRRRRLHAQHGRSDRTHARDRRQPPADIIVSMPLHQLGLDFFEACFDRGILRAWKRKRSRRAPAGCRPRGPA